MQRPVLNFCAYKEVKVDQTLVHVPKGGNNSQFVWATSGGNKIKRKSESDQFDKKDEVLR